MSATKLPAWSGNAPVLNPSGYQTCLSTRWDRQVVERLVPLAQPGIEDGGVGDLRRLPVVRRGHRRLAGDAQHHLRAEPAEDLGEGDPLLEPVEQPAVREVQGLPVVQAEGLSAAAFASAARSSGPLLSGVGSPSVRSTRPTRYPCSTSLARVPPQPISASSGWGADGDHVQRFRQVGRQSGAARAKTGTAGRDPEPTADAPGPSPVPARDERRAPRFFPGGRRPRPAAAG